MKPTVVILAAGMGSRYGGLKQVDPVGPSGETIMDYSVFDALRSGFGRIVFVIRREFDEVFRTTIGARYAGAVEVAYAYQSLDDLPGGFTVPEGRVKPWGTAHAIRAAREVVDTPFAAINADDFYGRDAFQRLATFLNEASSGTAKPRFTMVGYRLDQTLSEYGSVARGVCDVGPDGLLVSVAEMTRLVRVPGGAENREDPEHPVALTGAERVSMNLWGFTPALFDALEHRFPVWLAVHAKDPKAEWYIPFVVDDMIRDGAAEVAVLPTESAWYGVTYREDKPRVVEAVRQLVAAGEYPAKLW
ncbi:MAG TPA: sugar phosphate nucleotidyltransferase [Kiritimatiellia bacterium]|nr:sugar phosphate nucleotidyltransferase [Kiritimatiellia bacterium]HRU70847.1 sugar phosphate nucleotidyltransferase [Kiritimatiellia bacterium]